MANSRLRDIRAQLDAGIAPRVTVRELLSWFGAKRRGIWIVQEVLAALEELGLTTFPDFRVAYIDGEVEFRVVHVPDQIEVDPLGDGLAGEPPDDAVIEDALAELARLVASEQETRPGSPDDPSYRIGMLPPANNRPVSLKPNDTIAAALSIMLRQDFSQVPVMTSERELKGVVSWRSIARHAALVGGAVEVREVMERGAEVSADVSLFESIPVIVRQDYVLVRDPSTKVYQGIVTSSDLALQFRALTEPFLLLGEIENHIRQVLAGRFSIEELAAARDPSEADRPVGSIADLAFGEYMRILENEANWAKCGIGLDRKTVVEDLHRVRRIRNDVMHFDPDPMDSDDLQFLRDMARLFGGLKALGLY